MNTPLVSIIIPAYNSAKYLPATIQSALDQTWANKEIIIVDDGSTDDSIKVASDYAALYREIKVIRQENKGASAARNTGLAVAKGDYIQFLDADDLLSKDKIESQIRCLNGSQEKVGLCSTVYFKDSDDVYSLPVIKEWYSTGSNDPVDFLLKLYAGNETMPGYGGMVQPNAWLTPKQIIEKAGPWNEFRCPDDDGEFFCRVILASKGIEFSMQGINYYRKFDNGNSLSSQKSREAIGNVCLSIDLKYQYVKAKTNAPIVDRIFARHYWWTGVLAYPQFKDLSKYCVQKASRLGYAGEKYVGGPGGHLLTKYLGWKAARIFAHYKLIFKKRWAL